MRAKDIEIKPISRQDADKIVKELHYSGKTVNNSQIHLGFFLDGKCSNRKVKTYLLRLLNGMDTSPQFLNRFLGHRTAKVSPSVECRYVDLGYS